MLYWNTVMNLIKQMTSGYIYLSKTRKFDIRCNSFIISISCRTIMSQLQLDAISPFGFACALMMIRKSDADIIARYLGITPVQDVTIIKIKQTCNVFNAMFVSNMSEFIEEYRETASRCDAYFEIMNMNLSSSRDQINEIVGLNTNDLIKNILKYDNITIITDVLIVNTLYFNNKWEQPFDTAHDGVVHSFNEAYHQMMTHTESLSCPYYADASCRVVEIPYSGHNYSFGIIMMNDPSADPTERDVTKYFEHLRYMDMLITMPKFQQTSRVRLREVFFGCNVPDIIQEIVVNVSESGTSATCIEYDNLDDNEDCISFVVNRSFTYYIKHMATSTLLFVGTYRGL